MEIGKAGAIPTPVYSTITGRIGENPAHMSMNETEDRVEVSGSVGNRMVSIHEYKSGGMGQITGYVWGSGKNDNIMIWVNGFEGNKSLSGNVGKDYVNVQERSFGNQIQITGWVGQKWVNVYGNRFGSGVSFHGNVGSDANSAVYLSSFETPTGAQAGYEAIIPALIYTKKDQ